MEKQNRLGKTIITSVSVSKEFTKLIEQYNISPTECYRKGVAVTLCDLGVGMYQSQKNEDRIKYVKEFMAKIEQDEKIRKQFAQFKKFELISNHLHQIKLIAGEIDGE